MSVQTPVTLLNKKTFAQLKERIFLNLALCIFMIGKMSCFHLISTVSGTDCSLAYNLLFFVVYLRSFMVLTFMTTIIIVTYILRSRYMSDHTHLTHQTGPGLIGKS